MFDQAIRLEATINAIADTTARNSAHLKDIEANLNALSIRVCGALGALAHVQQRSADNDDTNIAMLRAILAQLSLRDDQDE